MTGIMIVLSLAALAVAFIAYSAAAVGGRADRRNENRKDKEE